MPRFVMMMSKILESFTNSPNKLNKKDLKIDNAQNSLKILKRNPLRFCQDAKAK